MHFIYHYIHSYYNSLIHSPPHVIFGWLWFALITWLLGFLPFIEESHGPLTIFLFIIIWGFLSLFWPIVLPSYFLIGLAAVVIEAW